MWGGTPLSTGKNMWWGLSIIKIEELHPEREDEWDNLILNSPSAEFLQSFYWSQLLSDLYDYKPVFLQINTDNEQPLARFSFTEQYPSIKDSSLISRLMNRCSHIFLKQIVSMGGPVIIEDTSAVSCVDILLDYVDSYSGKNKIRSVTISPFRYQQNYSTNQEILDLFMKKGYSKKIWGSYLIDLSVSEDELLKSFEHSARKSLKQMIDKKIIIKKVNGSDEYIEKFIKPYNRIEAEFGRSGIPICFAKKERISDISDKYYHYFYAEYNGNIEAVLGMFIYNGYATEVMSATSKLTYENKIYAQDVLHWEMYKYAKSVGCHTFDLAGVNPSPANSKEEGIRRFKKKWGGVYIEYPIFEKRFPGLFNTGLVQIKKLHSYITKRKE